MKKPLRTFFHDFTHRGLSACAEYSIEDGSACIWECWYEPGGQRFEPHQAEREEVEEQATIAYYRDGYDRHDYD